MERSPDRYPTQVATALTPEQSALYQSELSIYRYSITAETNALLAVLVDQETMVRKENIPANLQQVISESIKFANSLGMKDCDAFISELFTATDRSELNLNQAKALVYILHKREQTAVEIAKVKNRYGMPIKDVARETALIKESIQMCEEKGLSEAEEYIAKFMRVVIDRSCLVQETFLLQSN
jgi:chorismate mutase